MPEVLLKQGNRSLDANEYAVSIAVFMAIDQAKRLPLSSFQRTEVDNLEKWWTYKGRGGPLFVVELDVMLADTHCRADSFLQFLRPGMAKAEECGERINADYANRLVAALNWKPNGCLTTALFKACEQIIALISENMPD